jgi:hypothetical protein
MEEKYEKKLTGYTNKNLQVGSPQVGKVDPSLATKKYPNDIIEETPNPQVGNPQAGKGVKPTTSSGAKNALLMQRDKDREPVKGVFKYHENQGGVLKFSIKLYKEDKVETYELVDGGIYTLPRGVATHLNKNTFYPVYEHSRVAVESSGIPELKVKQKIFRTGFYPLDFVDVGESEQQAGLVTMGR